MPGLTVLTGVPVDPDAAEAQRWAEEELAEPIYQNDPGLLERILRFLGDLLDGIQALNVNAPSSLVPVLIVAAFVAVVVVSLLLGGRVRARRRAETPASHQLFEDTRDSADLTATADAAAARGDWATAVLERFRALVRSLDERSVLDDRPGMTAHEAAGMAAAALPDQARGIRWAGRLFDDVCYGHLTPTREDDARLRELAAATSRARPVTGPRRVRDEGWVGVR